MDLQRTAGAGADDCGVVYLGFGAPYLAMALASAVSLRATNPELPICVLTNVTDAPPDVEWWRDGPGGDRWVFLSATSAENRSYKTDMLAHSPFERAIYLDCDTLVVGRLDPLWPILDHFDLLLRPVPRPGYRDLRILDGALRFEDVTHFNAGVLGFRRSPETDDFFRHWQESYRTMGMEVDQPALMEALFRTRARVFPLRSQYNEEEIWPLTPADRAQVAIWHYKCRTADRRTRQLIRAALTWFPSAVEDQAGLESLFQDRRRLEGGPVRSRLRSLVTELRGPLSLRPAHAVGEARWRAMTAPHP